jgi:hypothetical protein
LIDLGKQNRPTGIKAKLGALCGNSQGSAHSIENVASAMNLAVINHLIGAEDPQPKTPDLMYVGDHFRRIAPRLKLKPGALHQRQDELITRFFESLPQVIALETKDDILGDCAGRPNNRRVVDDVPYLGTTIHRKRQSELYFSSISLFRILRTFV